MCRLDYSSHHGMEPSLLVFISIYNLYLHLHFLFLVDWFYWQWSDGNWWGWQEGILGWLIPQRIFVLIEGIFFFNFYFPVKLLLFPFVIILDNINYWSLMQKTVWRSEFSWNATGPFLGVIWNFIALLAYAYWWVFIKSCKYSGKDWFSSRLWNILICLLVVLWINCGWFGKKHY